MRVTSVYFASQIRQASILLLPIVGNYEGQILCISQCYISRTQFHKIQSTDSEFLNYTHKNTHTHNMAISSHIITDRRSASHSLSQSVSLRIRPPPAGLLLCVQNAAVCQNWDAFSNDSAGMSDVSPLYDTSRMVAYVDLPLRVTSRYDRK